MTSFVPSDQAAAAAAVFFFIRSRRHACMQYNNQTQLLRSFHVKLCLIYKLHISAAGFSSPAVSFVLEFAIQFFPRYN
jgi:hypothetical protein